MATATAVNVRIVSTSETRKTRVQANTTVAVQNIVRATGDAAIQGPFDTVVAARAWITAHNALVAALSVAAITARGIARETYTEVA